jgi:hypothetical protein
MLPRRIVLFCTIEKSLTCNQNLPIFIDGDALAPSSVSTTERPT